MDQHTTTEFSLAPGPQGCTSETVDVCIWKVFFLRVALGGWSQAATYPLKTRTLPPGGGRGNPTPPPQCPTGKEDAAWEDAVEKKTPLLSPNANMLNTGDQGAPCG